MSEDENNVYAPMYNASALAFSWNDHPGLIGKTVMDIGAERHSGSTHAFLEMFPDVRHFIAIDKRSSPVIGACELPWVQHRVADILDWRTLEEWEGKIDVIISMFCFDCFDNKSLAFENVYRLLVLGGTATIAFFLYADHYYLDEELGPKYREYLQGYKDRVPESHKNNLCAIHYEKVIEKLGFRIIRCEHNYHVKVFESDEECKDFLVSTSSMESHIPSELKPTFREDLFTTLLKYRSRNYEGKAYFVIRFADICLEKQEPIEQVFSRILLSLSSV